MLISSTAFSVNHILIEDKYNYDATKLIEFPESYRIESIQIKNGYDTFTKSSHRIDAFELNSNTQNQDLINHTNTINLNSHNYDAILILRYSLNNNHSYNTSGASLQIYLSLDRPGSGGQLSRGAQLRAKYAGVNRAKRFDELQSQHLARLKATGKIANMPGYRLTGIGKDRRWRKVEGTTGLKRPGLRTSTKQQIMAATPRNRYGQFEDQFGIIEDIHFGHVGGHENRRIIAAAEELGISQEQLNNYVNANPQFFKIERASINVSHVDEVPGIDGYEDIMIDMMEFFGL